MRFFLSATLSWSTMVRRLLFWSSCWMILVPTVYSQTPPPDDTTNNDDNSSNNDDNNTVGQLTASSRFSMVLRPVPQELQLADVQALEGSVATTLLVGQSSAAGVSFLDLSIVIQETEFVASSQAAQVRFFVLATAAASPSTSSSTPARVALDELVEDVLIDSEMGKNFLYDSLGNSGRPALANVSQVTVFPIPPPPGVDNSTGTAPTRAPTTNPESPSSSSSDGLSVLDIVLIAVSGLIFLGIVYMIWQHHQDRGYIENQRVLAANSLYGDHRSRQSGSLPSKLPHHVVLVAPQDAPSTPSTIHSSSGGGLVGGSAGASTTTTTTNHNGSRISLDTSTSALPTTVEPVPVRSYRSSPPVDDDPEEGRSRMHDGDTTTTSSPRRPHHATSTTLRLDPLTPRALLSASSVDGASIQSLAESSSATSNGLWFEPATGAINTTNSTASVDSGSLRKKPSKSHHRHHRHHRHVDKEERENSTNHAQQPHDDKIAKKKKKTRSELSGQPPSHHHQQETHFRVVGVSPRTSYNRGGGSPIQPLPAHRSKKHHNNVTYSAKRTLPAHYHHSSTMDEESKLSNFHHNIEHGTTGGGIQDVLAVGDEDDNSSGDIFFMDTASVGERSRTSAAISEWLKTIHVVAAGGDETKTSDVTNEEHEANSLVEHGSASWSAPSLAVTSLDASSLEHYSLEKSLASSVAGDGPALLSTSAIATNHHHHHHHPYKRNGGTPQTTTSSATTGRSVSSRFGPPVMPVEV